MYESVENTKTAALKIWTCEICEPVDNMQIKLHWKYEICEMFEPMDSKQHFNYRTLGRESAEHNKSIPFLEW